MGTGTQLFDSCCMMVKDALESCGKDPSIPSSTADILDLSSHANHDGVCISDA